MVNVHCIIVCYRPDILRLVRLCENVLADDPR